MQPDLFAGPTQRDDSYRLLARLANGGSVPASPRRWRVTGSQRMRLVAAGTLLLVVATAWLGLRDARVPAPAPATSAEHAQLPPIPPLRHVDAAPEPQAALIVSQPEAQATPAPRPATAASTMPPAWAPAEARAVRARPLKPGAQPKAKAPAAAESDEDVTLLAAMLKHAKPAKPPATPPPKD